MNLQACVVFVICVLMIITAQMAGQVLAGEMVVERKIVEKELFAQITVGMWQNFPVSVVSSVAEFNVVPERFYMIHALFFYENSTPFQTDLAKCFIVLGLQMSLQGFLSVEAGLMRRAISYRAIQSSQFHGGSLSIVIPVVNGIIVDIHFAPLPRFLVKTSPGEFWIICDYDLVEVCSADWALIIFQNDSHSQSACVAYGPVATDSKSPETDWILAQGTKVSGLAGSSVI